MSKPYFAHETACVDDPCEIGEGTKIWHFSHVMAGAKIGKNCILGQNVNVAAGVMLGDNAKVQNNVSIYTGITVEDDVFLAPGVILANDIHPGCPDAVECMEGPRIKRGAQIGINVSVLPRVIIGEHAVIGAGSVVTKDIPPGVVAYGNPAQAVCRVGDLTCTTGRRDKPYS